MHTTKNDTAGKHHAQRHAFALANNLIPKLKQQGITEQDLWQAVKNRYLIDRQRSLLLPCTAGVGVGIFQWIRR